MNILLTNDDGMDAEGLMVLRSVLEENGHRTFTFAPNSQMSIQSHAMTFPGKGGIRKVRERVFSVSGTPADCVYEAFMNNLDPKDIDVVISGINKGYNLSGDILLSGTYNAAVEGVFFGKKAIAIAAEDSPEIEDTYKKAASFIADNLSLFISAPQGSVVNINVPFKGEYDNWEMAEIGDIRHKDSAHLEDKEHALFFSTFHRVNGFRTDHSVVSDGKISVSVLLVKPQGDLGTMKKWNQTR